MDTPAQKQCLKILCTEYRRRLKNKLSLGEVYTMLLSLDSLREATTDPKGLVDIEKTWNKANKQWDEYFRQAVKIMKSKYKA